MLKTSSIFPFISKHRTIKYNSEDTSSYLNDWMIIKSKHQND